MSIEDATRELAQTQRLAYWLAGLTAAVVTVMLAVRGARQRRRWARYHVEDDTIARHSGAEVYPG